MGSISVRKRKNGSPAYMARVRVIRDGKAYHDTETFDTRLSAKAWMARRESEMQTPAGLLSAAGNDPPLSAVIERYVTESLAAIGRTKAQVLRSIKAMPIAEKRCSRITSADLVGMAHDLSANVTPQTTANYLSHLGSVFAIARPAWQYPLDQQAMKDAFVVSRRLGYTSRSDQRDRRPTLPEIDKLMHYYGITRLKRRSSAPMQAIIAFAIFSTRRLEEITRIAWLDYEPQHSRVMVRDMKHPGDKIGNHQWCDLTPEAMAVIEAQPRSGALIFPYNAETISSGFTRACHLLGIEDLHFHDLRHDGISRLFEMGWGIPHVATVSAHRSWQSLKRYTHIRQSGDKYAGWNWLAVATKKDPH